MAVLADVFWPLPLLPLPAALFGWRAPAADAAFVDDEAIVVDGRKVASAVEDVSTGAPSPAPATSAVLEELLSLKIRCVLNSLQLRRSEGSNPHTILPNSEDSEKYVSSRL